MTRPRSDGVQASVFESGRDRDLVDVPIADSLRNSIRGFDTNQHVLSLISVLHSPDLPALPRARER
jgi:hypothetical protein